MEETLTDNSVVKQRPPHLFKPGQSGNLKGRPKGSISLTTKIKQILEDNPEQLAAVIKSIFEKHPDLVWKQIDGMPKQAVAVEGNLNISITDYKPDSDTE